MKLFKRFVILTLFLVILLSNAPGIVFAMQNADINDEQQFQSDEETENSQNGLEKNKVNKYEESYNQNTIDETYRKVNMVSSENEQELTSTKYVVDKQNLLIKKILPETDITYFKTKFNVPESDVKVYEDASCAKEVTSGIVTTEMAVKIANTSTVYRACVIGDFNNDGKMAEIELNQVIKHVAGLKEYKLAGLDLINADVNYDGKVDQIDITIIIRWIVYKELNIPAPPIIEVVDGEKDANGTYLSDVTVKIKEGNNAGVEVQKTTYSINYGEEIEIRSGETITLTKNGEYKIIAYTYLEEGIRSRSTLTIKIERSMDKVTVNLDENEFTYDGTAKEPEVTVKDGTKTLVKDVNYTVSYSNNINAGTATITITGKGEYTGSKTVNFTINKAKNPISVTGKTGLAYNGSAQELVTVTNAQGTVYYSTDTVLTSSNYTSGNTSIPTGTEAELYIIYYYTPGNNNYSEKSGSTMVAIVESVAKIGTVTFQSLQSAINEVPTNNVQTTITMLKDTSECVDISENKNIMLDLASYTVTNGEDEGAPTITSNGTLTVKGGTLTSANNSTIQNTGTLNIIDTANIGNDSGGSDYASIYATEGAITTISGGTLTEAARIITNYGALNITGGTVTSAKSGYAAIFNYGTLNMSGGTIQVEKTMAIWNEGTLNISGTANIAFTDSERNGVEAGFIGNSTNGIMTISGGTITADHGHIIRNHGMLTVTGGIIKTTEFGQAVLNNGTLEISGTANMGGVSYYTSYETSIINMKGGTVNSITTGKKTIATITGGTITNGITNQGTLNISGTANITSDYGVIYNKAEATATISGGTITSKNGIAIDNEGTLEISGTAKIENTSTVNFSAVYNVENGTVTITGGTVTSESGKAIWNFGMLDIKDEAKIISNDTVGENDACAATISIESTGTTKISGGTITSKNGIAIDNEGTLEISGTAKIETTSTVNFSAVYNVENATVNVSGGTITSTSKAVINFGTLNVSGGTITSTSETVDNYGTLNVSGTAKIETTSTEKNSLWNTGTATITGGTITSESSNTVINCGILNIKDNANIVCNSENNTAVVLYDVDNAILNMSGGTITSLGSYCLWINKAKTVTITGGTIDGSQAEFAIHNCVDSNATVNISPSANIIGGMENC